MPSPSSASDHHLRDPLHGVTLEAIVKQLVARHGWDAMGDRIPVRCFLLNPSVKSSLTFLRKTPWARKKVEAWFVEEAEIREPVTDTPNPPARELRDNLSPSPVRSQTGDGNDRPPQVQGE